jgi:flagellar biosynthetic protein FliO
LSAVLGLVFIMKWGAKSVTGRARKSSGVISVLARSALGPRQQLTLVQIGRRVVLLGSAGNQINALCEIEKPEEVAELLARVKEEQSQFVGKTFAALFRRESEKFEGSQAPVRREQDLDSGESFRADGAAAQVVPEQAVLSQTHDELRGLMEKVRGLSKSFKNESVQ